jgi:uncharacterized damage-inducible protein DinB
MKELQLIPFHHDLWATTTLLNACRPLSEQQLDQPFQMGPGSVRRTFLHMISAKLYWTDRLRNHTRQMYPPESHRTASIEKITSLNETVSMDFQQLAITLIESKRLNETIFATPRPGAHPIRIASVLYHVPNHGTHHRAQILNMLRHLGVSPLPAVDVDDWEQTLL